MMGFLASAVLCFLFTACGGETGNGPLPSIGAPSAGPTQAPQREQLTFGSFSGECSGYCQVTYTVFPTSVDRRVEPWNNDTVAFPVRRQSLSIPSAQYDSLFARLDRKAFLQLDDRIGCPDCADGGAEWILLSGPEGTKSVTFDYGAEIPAVAPLLEAIRAIQDDPRWESIR
ncbi:MAG TPA: hypothetical protein VGE21_16900 [Flavobacteriales bacterium]